MAEPPLAPPPSSADSAFVSPASRVEHTPASAPGRLPGHLTRVGKALAVAVRKFVRDVIRQLDRETVARIYLKGDGIEIGALHNRLRVPSAVNVRYVDRMSTPELRRQYPELADLDLVDVDIVDDGERLTTLGAATQDFLIACQVLEHCQNPLFTLEQWLRVLKDGGVLLMTLPDKRFSFDVGRQATNIDHLLRDYREGPEWSRRQHFDEWVRLVEHAAPHDVPARTDELMRVDYSIHFHVWTQADMLDLVATAQRLFRCFEIELFLKTDFEVEQVIVLRKTPPSPPVVTPA